MDEVSKANDMTANIPNPDGKPFSPQCVIAGAGPAGLMLGLLLARAGVRVAVVERHDDFRRDFRGDTIHPSTLEVMHEIGLLGPLLELPHTKAPKLHADVDGRSICIADFARLPVRARYIAFMPQWEFLNFLAERAGEYSNFRLYLGWQACDLIWREGRVCGLEMERRGERHKLAADLVVAADGRRSEIRRLSGLPVQGFGAPRDVVWFKLPLRESDPKMGMTHAGPRQGLILIDRGEFWQCGYAIGKGRFDELVSNGMELLRSSVRASAPFLSDRIEKVGLDDLHLLSIRIDRLEKWWLPGLLFIGDAAHAMSPIGGVGVNLAIQDAVAAANILSERLRTGSLHDRDLRRVQDRRMFPTKATQKLQLMMQGRTTGKPNAPRRRGLLRTVMRMLPMAHLAGRIIGLGFRPEHIAVGVGPSVCEGSASQMVKS